MPENEGRQGQTRYTWEEVRHAVSIVISVALVNGEGGSYSIKAMLDDGRPLHARVERKVIVRPREDAPVVRFGPRSGQLN